MGEYTFVVIIRVSHLYLEDHASGAILVREAGGIITNSLGQPLDFGLGRTLGENHGIVAAGRDVHARVLAAVQTAKERADAVE